MKNFLSKILIISTLLSFNAFSQIKTPAVSPAATVSQALGLTKITIDYSRPSVKGRKIFGDLVPYGKVWRTGANTITSIKFDDEVLVNGAAMKAGSYGLYTIPGASEWTIILNRDDKQWGAYGYDDKKDVIRFTVQPLKPEVFQEQMSIGFEEFTPTTTFIVIKWESVEVKFKVEQQVEEKIMAEIKEKTSKSDVSGNTLFAAADYYFQKSYDLPQALAWATKVLEKSKEYWNYQLVARIAAKQGNCEVAVPNAEKSLELAKKANDFAYIKLNEKVFADCGKK